MKVIMMRPSYKPELSGGTHLAVDLVEDLIARGHEVEVVTPIKSKYLKLVNTNLDECKIHRIVSKHSKTNVISRVLRYFDVSKKMYKTAKKIEGADIIMTHSMPPLLGPLGAKLAKRKKLPVVYWEQDIVSQSLLSTEIFGQNNLKTKMMFKVAESLEKKTERKSDKIITISKRFRDMHLKRGISNEKLQVVYNWVDTNQVYPVDRKDNVLFDELCIPRDKFIVSYCGNLGVPQNVEVLIDCAEKMQDNKEILFVIFGGGSREKYIKNYIEKKALKNLLFFPLQPLERSHYVYSLGDVGVVIGKKGTSNNGFPSKTWSIMSAGQAIVSCFDLESELSLFIEQSKGGVAVAPDSPELLQGAVLKLYDNKEETKKMGVNARNYIINNFSRQKSTKDIIDVLENMVKK